MIDCVDTYYKIADGRLTVGPCGNASLILMYIIVIDIDCHLSCALYITITIY